MQKEKRHNVYLKYDGLCGYTGKPLLHDWQIDHITSKCQHQFIPRAERFDVNAFENLMPCNRIINHYKRAATLEGFRSLMLLFHIRLGKLPKTTKVEATKRRIIYMQTVADMFDITIDKPFSGTFYFETL